MNIYGIAAIDRFDIGPRTGLRSMQSSRTGLFISPVGEHA